jgi:hypothetical protein
MTLREGVLQQRPVDADHVRLAALEARLAEREEALAGVKTELRQLQARYLDKIGPLYAEVSRLETAVAEAEIRLGLRQPPEPEDEAGGAAERGPSPCASSSAASADLKRVFRDVAKAVHPDRGLDEIARSRRHSLMAEANRAYAEQDEDRLRLILRAWERSPDSEIADDPDVERDRVRRRMAAIGARLVDVDGELSDLRRSAIFGLKEKIDEAHARSWDLFAEMVLTVRRDIGRARRRLAALGERSALD